MAEPPIVLAQVPAPPQPPVIIDAAPGQVIDLRATADRDAALSIDGDDLIVTRPDAPPVVVRDLVDAAAADPPPIVQLADAAIPAPELVGRVAPFAAVPVTSLLQEYAPPSDEPFSTPTLEPLFEPPPITVATAHHDPDGLGAELDGPGPGVVQPALPATPPVAAAGVAPAPAEDNSLALLLADQDEPPIPSVISGTTGGDDVTLVAPLDGGTVDLGAGNDRLTLADGGNSLSVHGVEALTGGSGDDLVAIDAAAVNVDLLSGEDTLDLSGLAAVDLGALDERGVERIDLRGGGATTLTIDPADILGTSPTTDTLLVRGDAEDTVVLGNGWTPAGSQADPGGGAGTFNVYTHGTGAETATLLVESQVSVA